MFWLVASAGVGFAARHAAHGVVGGAVWQAAQGGDGGRQVWVAGGLPYVVVGDEVVMDGGAGLAPRTAAERVEQLSAPLEVLVDGNGEAVHIYVRDGLVVDVPHVGRHHVQDDEFELLDGRRASTQRRLLVHVLEGMVCVFHDVARH